MRVPELSDARSVGIPHRKTAREHAARRAARLTDDGVVTTSRRCRDVVERRRRQRRRRAMQPGRRRWSADGAVASGNAWPQTNLNMRCNSVTARWFRTATTVNAGSLCQVARCNWWAFNIIARTRKFVGKYGIRFRPACNTSGARGHRLRTNQMDESVRGRA